MSVVHAAYESSFTWGGSASPHPTTVASPTNSTHHHHQQHLHPSHPSHPPPPPPLLQPLHRYDSRETSARSQESLNPPSSPEPLTPQTMTTTSEARGSPDMTTSLQVRGEKKTSLCLSSSVCARMSCFLLVVLFTCSFSLVLRFPHARQQTF